jgi:hypothetical protein
VIAGRDAGKPGADDQDVEVLGALGEIWDRQIDLSILPSFPANLGAGGDQPDSQA